jgi:phage minor structural protein
MIEVFDKTRRRVAILENAYAISENQTINAIWYLYFSLPYKDSKNQYCQPFYYVRHDEGELYRIMPETLTVDESGGIAYQCEHVLATLIDNVLFGYHVVGNLGTYTDDVIRYILDRQLEKNWTLAECDFRNQYEYGWEQESLLSALFSVATPLASPMWVTDTSVYPWRLSLKRLDTTGRPEMYIRRRHNMTSYSRNKDPQNIVTRLYPLGYGEGVNQLGIKDVNGGVPYLQSPKAITDKYGIIERVWIDRRYEDAASLKAAAEAMLAELQEPLLSYSVGFQELTTSDYDKAAIGKRVRIIFPEIGESVDTYITEISRKYDDLKESSLTVANRETSIASSLADMADRQRIEQTYAQGATQIYSQALQANCSSESGATMDFFLPEEMRIVNKVLVKIRVKKFRAYSKATSTSASKVATSDTTESEDKTSSSGGKTTATTSSGGGTYTSTSQKASQSVTSTAVVLSAENIMPSNAAMYDAAKHNHGIPEDTKLAIYGGKDENGNVIADGYTTWIPSGAHSHGEHSHTISIPAHSHSVDIDDHSHSVTIPNHTHTFTIPGHSHKVTIPSHDHTITPGIYEYGSPKKFDLYVNGTKKRSFEGSTAELDITSLLTGSDNMIPRGTWLSLEVRPDDLAYISIDLIVQGFIQSRGDNTV